MSITLILPKQRIDELFALKFGKINLEADITEIKTGLTKIDLNLLAGTKFYINKTGKPCPEQTNIPCPYCRHQFDDQPLPLLCRKSTVGKETGYHGDELFCSYNCNLAYIQETRLDSNYKNAERLLRELFNIQCPNQELKPAPDWRLLKDRGYGNLSYAEFKQNSVTYKKTPNVYFFPIIRKYEF